VLRIIGPCEVAGLTVLRGTRWAGDELLSEVGLIDEADLVVIQRDFPRYWEKYADVVARARAKALPVVYELDDLLFGLPESHPDWRHYRDARVPMLRAAWKLTPSQPARRRYAPLWTLTMALFICCPTRWTTVCGRWEVRCLSRLTARSSSDIWEAARTG